MMALPGPGRWADTAPPPELLRAIDEFNQGAFFECHETLEALWRAEPGPLRDFYQGVLQIGVAFYHQRRGNYRGATLLLDRGIARLAAFAPRCLGIDVAALLLAARTARTALHALGPARCHDLDPALVPSLRFTERSQPSHSD